MRGDIITLEEEQKVICSLLRNVLNVFGCLFCIGNNKKFLRTKFTQHEPWPYY